VPTFPRRAIGVRGEGKIPARFKKFQEKLPDMFLQVAYAESLPCKTFLFVFLTVAQNSGKLKFLLPPQNVFVPVWLWLELSTMVCCRCWQ